jgi:hypothetical protein
MTVVNKTMRRKAALKRMKRKKAVRGLNVSGGVAPPITKANVEQWLDPLSGATHLLNTAPWLQSGGKPSDINKMRGRIVWNNDQFPQIREMIVRLFGVEESGVHPPKMFPITGVHRSSYNNSGRNAIVESDNVANMVGAAVYGGKVYFPPCLGHMVDGGNGQAELDDGRSRTVSSIILGEEYISLIIIEASPEVIAKINAFFNCHQGQRPTRAERVKRAVSFIRNGTATVEEVARMTGDGEKYINQRVKFEEFNEDVVARGVSNWDEKHVGTSVREALIPKLLPYFDAKRYDLLVHVCRMIAEAVLPLDDAVALSKKIRPNMTALALRKAVQDECEYRSEIKRSGSRIASRIGAIRRALGTIKNVSEELDNYTFNELWPPPRSESAAQYIVNLSKHALNFLKKLVESHEN